MLNINRVTSSPYPEGLAAMTSSFARALNISQFATPAYAAALRSATSSFNEIQGLIRPPTISITSQLNLVSSLTTTLSTSQFTNLAYAAALRSATNSFNRIQGLIRPPTISIASQLNLVSSLASPLSLISPKINIDSLSGILQVINNVGATAGLTRQTSRIAALAVGRGFTLPSMRLHDYGDATAQLLNELGLLGSSNVEDLPFVPSNDDTAFDIIRAEAPKVANAVEGTAERVASPFLSKKTIRNSLAWTVAAFLVLAYVGGAVLCPPWGAIVTALLSAAGVTAPAAFKRVADTQRAESPDSAD